jgi:hypothetical protein
MTEQNLQIKEPLSPLQETMSGVQKANLHPTRGNESLQQSLYLLLKEVLDLQEVKYSFHRWSNGSARSGNSIECCLKYSMATVFVCEAQFTQVNRVF